MGSISNGHVNGQHDSNSHLNGNHDSTSHFNGNHDSNSHLNGNGVDGHSHGPSTPEPIAIVGMALRLPGKIHSPEALWRLLIDKKDTRGTVPPTRYNADGFYSASRRPGCTGVKYGHFLDDSDGIDLLDTSFFTMSKAEVEKLDPQQRMLLEVVYECMENGGQRDWRSSNTGVFVGTWGDDWQDFLAKDPQQTGGMLNVSGAGDFAISNRVSYEYDLQGPSMTIKAACASSVICLHEACQAILNGDCDSAIVAGTNLILTPSQTISQTEAGVLSPTGQCRTFDASANGYARGEAINAIYIKKLSDAIRDHDPIRAIVRATAVNCDGRSAGLSQPNPEAHERLIRRAYARAGLTDFSETPFVEVHGTGTPSGDPLELQAISKVFGGDRDTYVGSVKANVGHGEGASGITSIIKAVMALEHQTIPPQVNFSTPNPKIPFEEARLVVPLEPIPWPSDRPQRISVNSFGITGANAHAIIESAASYGIHRGHAMNGIGDSVPNGVAQHTSESALLLFSATNAESLKKRASDIRDHALSLPDKINDLAYTLAVRRDHLPHRAFSVTNGVTMGDFIAADKAKQAPQPVFVFTGQGAQWPAMGKELVEIFPSFQDDILRFSQLLGHLPHPPPWDLTEELLKFGPKSRLDKAQFAQPLCTALQVALVNLLRDLGVVPTAVVGHSSGEIAAAYAAGAITAEEAIIIAYYRGFTATSSSQKGAMAAVGIGRAEAILYLEQGVVIACDNSPNSVTLSGDEDALDRMTEQMKFDDDGLFIRRLKTDGMAYHSHHMLEVGNQYEELLKPLVMARTPAIPLYSTVTGRLAEDRPLGPSYWRENLESPVKFYPAVRNIVESLKADLLFLEIGPHSAMAGPLRQIFKATPSKSRLTYLPTLTRGKNAHECILEMCGNLFLQTVPVRFDKLTPGCQTLTDVPNYPWRHDISLWAENRVVKEWRTRRFPPHELLGARILEGNDFEPTWRNLLQLKDASWLQDHKVLEDVVFPCAGYIAMAGEAVRQLTGSGDYSICNLSVKSALILQEKTVELFTSFRRSPLTSSSPPEWYEFAVYSHNGSIWTQHCDGQARGGSDERHLITDTPALTPLPRRIRSPYPAFHNVGLNYGPTFAGIRDLSVKPGGKTAVATLQQPPITGSEYSLHPTTIDQCLQLLGAASSEGLGRHLAKIPLPTSIKQLYIRPATTGNYMQAQATARPSRNVGDIEGEMLIAEGDQILLSVKGCKLSAFEHESDVDIDDRIAAARLSWRPDLDFIPLDSLMISHVKDPDAIKMVEAYGLLCTQEMQERIRGVEYCADHFTKFSHWMDNHVEEGRNAKNELVTNSTELLNLPREERLKLIVQLEQQLKTSEFNNVAELITRLLDNCVDVFKGDSQILDIYLRDNGLTKLYAITGDRIDSTEFFATAGHTNPTMKILEIGAGTGGTTLVALQSLCSINGEPMYSKYTFTDISSGFFSAAKDRFAEYPGLEFKTLDISRDPQEQGFELGTYDLIVASNVIHATDTLYVTLSNVRKLLHPRGRFFLQELTPSYAKMINIIMGPLPGWWLGEADGRGMEPIVSTERWDKELRAAGFSGIECAVRDDPRLEGSIGVNMIAKPAQDVQDYRTVTLLTLADQADSDPVRAIEQLLVDQGYHIAKCIFGEDLPPFQDVISLVELNDALFDGASPEQFKTFQQVIAGLNSARLLWVMRAAQIEPQSPTTALTLGLTRSIRTELNIPLAALEVDTCNIKASHAIVEVFEKFRDTASEINPDYEYVYHNQQVLVGRYHWRGVTKELAASHDISGYPLRLEGDRSGASRWVPVTPQELEPDGVQVASAFIGVDRKAAAAHGGASPLLGGSGNVTAVGSAVKNVRAGDRVMILDQNLLATSAVVQAHRLAVIPESLSLEDAASLSVAVPAAIYALLYAGNLQKGQSVLIQSAFDDVGHAAIQIARMAEAEVYCTVSKDTEAAFVSSEFDIPPSHIFRSSSCSSALIQETGGRGVDVILNSPPDELARDSWKCLARRGKMIDLSGNGVVNTDLLGGNKTCIRVDMNSLDDLYSELLQKVIELHDEGRIKLFGSPHMIDARAHEKSDNSPIPDPPSRLIVRIPERTECLPVTQTRPALKLRHDAAYLLVGGLGGLGQAIATYMAECGARHFIFLSRSCGKSDEHVQFFQELESQGCTVTAVAGDVSNPEDVNAMVIQSSRPIAGVLQLAMVLQDRPFLKMSHEDWTTSIKPKVDGTWNLHQALKDRQLDFFVIFGSISGTFGIAHQANYAASNTFQDAFVQYRHSLGLPASVLNIGAMADIGYVSQNQSVQEYFRSAGMPFMSETELLEAMHLSIVQQHQQQQEQPVSSTTVGLGFTSTSQLALGIRATKPMDDPSNRVLWKRDRRVDIYRNIEASRRLQGSAGTTDAAADQDKLDAFINEVKSSPSLLDRPDTLGLLTHEIGVSIYGFMLQPVEDLDVSKSLMTLGVDSLVTIEIKNWLKRRLDVEVSTLEILNGGTIESLGQLAFSRLRKKYGGDVSL